MATEAPRLPAGRQLVKKVRWDFFDKLTAKSQNKKQYFAILAAAAGDRTRKGTLTVPFHTILPSDTCGQAEFWTD